MRIQSQKDLRHKTGSQAKEYAGSIIAERRRAGAELEEEALFGSKMAFK